MRRGFLLLLLPILLALAVSWSIGIPERSVFEGKSIDQWLDGGYEDASRALQEVGPSAAQDVFNKLNREHPKYGSWGRYRRAWEKAPAFCRRVLPKPKVVGFDEWRASHALLAIGPRVIPLLGQSLGDSRSLVRSVSAQTLVHFHESGSRIEAVCPALRQALNDSDPNVREFARQALTVRTREQLRVGSLQ